MTNNYLLNYLRPVTLAQLIAELINDHADEDSTGEFTFHTEEAAQAYRELLVAGEDNIGDDEFWALIESALAHAA